MPDLARCGHYAPRARAANAARGNLSGNTLRMPPREKVGAVPF